MSASPRPAILRLRRNRAGGGPSLAWPAPERNEAAQPSLRPLALSRVAESAMAEARKAGAGSREQCEAAFRALLEYEPCLPVAKAQRIIDAGLGRRRGGRGRPAAGSPGAQAWVALSTVFALLAAVAAVPFAVAVWSSWWGPEPAPGAAPLFGALALSLPVSLLVFPALAWRCLRVRRPGAAVALACLPLIHTAGTAASLALP